MFASLFSSRPLNFACLTVLLIMSAALQTGCQTSPHPPLQAMDRHVDLPRFMGDWYVLANIPTWIERDAVNAIESYSLNPDGTIATTFTFRRGSAEGALKTYRPTGFIHNRETNAEWRMQFLWPFKAAFLITHLDDAYQTTLIGVPSRRYLWIMARQPSLPQAELDALIDLAVAQGHDRDRIQLVPQPQALTGVQ